MLPLFYVTFVLYVTFVFMLAMFLCYLCFYSTFIFRLTLFLCYLFYATFVLCYLCFLCNLYFYVAFVFIVPLFLCFWQVSIEASVYFTYIFKNTFLRSHVNRRLLLYRYLVILKKTVVVILLIYCNCYLCFAFFSIASNQLANRIGCLLQLVVVFWTKHQRPVVGVSCQKLRSVCYR